MKTNKQKSRPSTITFYKSFFLLLLILFLTTSINAQIRQDLNSLTSANRTILVNLMRDYITRDVIEDHCSYTVKTGNSSTDIHSDVNFLPFHRAYVEAMEDYFIRRGFPQFVPLPSWNPATAVPTEFRVVDADCSGISCANSTINCNNPTNWVPNRARPRYLSLPVLSGTNNDLCDFPFTTTSNGLSRVIEGENNVVNSTYHNSVHAAMGGAMGQFTSPAAPIFFCWHAYVDDIWKQYQCSCTNGGGRPVDLYMKDTPKVPHNERDGGNEPNIDNGTMTVSTDIWVRNQNDGTTNQVNQNPISGVTNYVFVRVRNRGCQSSTGNEQLRLHWSKGATAMTWPSFWDGSTSINGNVISTVNIPVMTPGKSTIIVIQWTPPSPSNYPTNPTPSLFGLLARIVATNDPMTVAEGATVATNIRNNNNIVSRNITVNQGTGGNVAPTVSITSPGNNTTFIAPATIYVTANAADSDGSINRVEFYQGTTLLGSDATSPYEFTWTDVPVGNYAITAKAFDNLSASTTSAVVNVAVINFSFPYYMGNNTVTSCTGTLFDDGGSMDNYLDNGNLIFVINPGSTSLSMEFSDWGLEANYDFLRIYNGTSISAPLIGSYSGTSPGTVIASSGAMTLHFTSDGSVTGIGWLSNWFATGGNCTTAKMSELTGIKSVSAENQFSIHPNPATDKITIDFATLTNTATKIFVYDLSGKELVLFNRTLEIGDHSMSFDISALPAGIYLCKIVEGEKISAKKFIKVN